MTTLYVVLARFQQVSTLFLIGAAVAWAVYAAGLDRPGLAVCGALLVLGGYVLVLGIEFVLMQLANRRDPLPAAKLGEILAAWLAESLCAPLVFCWRQPFRSTLIADRTTSRTARRGLVLAHGFVCNRGLWNGWYPRLIEQDIPFIGVNFEPVFGDIDEYTTQIERAVVSLEQSTGLPPVIVAHSMGGLVVRAWLRTAGPSAVERVHHIVTLGTPHRGTALARFFGFSENTRQMATTASWLGALLSSESPALAARLTCIFSNCDNMVFPTSTALLPNARNVHIEACAHVQMVDHPQAFAEVMRWLGSGSNDSLVAPPDSRATKAH